MILIEIIVKKLLTCGRINIENSRLAGKEGIVNYPFDALKATQVAVSFIEREGGEINVMKLVKLVYLLDRLSLDRRGIPVLGGDYFSMSNGPVISELLDLINSGSLYGATTDWERYISDRVEYKIGMTNTPGNDRLSDSEIEMINEIYAQHGDKDRYQLRDWCHENLPEWHPITKGRKEISVESIFEALGKSCEVIQELLKEQKELSYLDSLLA
jgi:uncharacterized phage-associated protein